MKKKDHIPVAQQLEMAEQILAALPPPKPPSSNALSGIVIKPQK